MALLKLSQELRDHQSDIHELVLGKEWYGEGGREGAPYPYMLECDPLVFVSPS